MSASYDRPRSSDTHHGTAADIEKSIPALNKADLPRRPWRRYVTPTAALLAERWEGAGTPEQPYIVSWLSDDPENPQTWSNSYKWVVTALVSVTTFVVALASSTYTGAIPDFYVRFPGYGTTIYILGLSVFVLGFAIVSHVRS
jgi:hypothetical protein